MSSTTIPLATTLTSPPPLPHQHSKAQQHLSVPSSTPRHLPLSSSTSSHHQWVETLRSQARGGSSREALDTYISMTSAGLSPDHFVFPAAVKAATGIKDKNVGQQLHAAATKLGYQDSPATIANTLVTMYAKCGDLESAVKLFDRMPERNQVSWNSMIAGFCMFEEWEVALQALRDMQAEGVELSSFVIVSAVLACSNLGREEGLRLGRQVHGQGLRRGFYTEGKTFANNSLLALYAKVGRMEDSWKLFDWFNNCDLVSWNTMISSCAQNDRFSDALYFFRKMIGAGIRPDGVTLASVLPACSHLELYNMGREIHAYALRNDDLFENSFVGSALLDMYCNCGKVECGHRVFARIKEWRLGLWNAMISGFAQNGLDDEALQLFIDMEVVAGLYPSATTIATVIPACVRSKMFHRMEDIHGYVVKRGFANDPYVQNALMDMYARMGMVEVSMGIFECIVRRDIVSWNTIITGCVICELYSDAFRLLMEMQRVENENVKDNGRAASYRKPNSITLISILPACASLAALAKGKEIHAYAIRNGLAADIAVGSALVDTYSKSGHLTYSRRVFDWMPKRNAITWNALIMAYGMHGHGDQAMKLFEDMVSASKVEQEVKPTGVTFISVFAACSHSGMVRHGLDLFRKLRSEYGMEPTPDHYACIVDLLGRAGQLEEAYKIINTMEPGKDRAGAWSSLLGACRMHRNVKLGEIAANHLFQLEPDVASHYVLLSNIYSSAGLWSEASEVRKNMRELGVRKEPGCSWIEVGDKVHQFLVGDLSHPQSEHLHAYLEKLWDKMKREGYVPDTSCVLHNVNEDEKEMLLCGHSEKLAIAFGILNTSPGSTIRVTKNLRICNDCHSAAKHISKIVEREIIVRDVRRFHHFRDGSCSCGDYW